LSGYQGDDAADDIMSWRCCMAGRALARFIRSWGGEVWCSGLLNAHTHTHPLFSSLSLCISCSPFPFFSCPPVKPIFISLSLTFLFCTLALALSLALSLSLSLSLYHSLSRSITLSLAIFQGSWHPLVQCALCSLGNKINYSTQSLN
jgi:hypothetical protein